eukprot:jgi/Ulvmu1/4319/UM002_0041.1
MIKFAAGLAGRYTTHFDGFDTEAMDGDDLLKMATFFHFHTCQVTPYCKASSTLAVTKFKKVHSKFRSSFVMAFMPPHLQHLQLLAGTELQPAWVKSNALIHWHELQLLKRVAYVKVLPCKPRQLIDGSGQIMYDDSRQDMGMAPACCVPFECLS